MTVRFGIQGSGQQIDGMPDPARYTWQPVTPGDPDHMPPAQRLLHVLADRQRWHTALALARANDVAVIVTDQRMPKMTGLDLLKAAREIRPTRSASS